MHQRIFIIFTAAIFGLVLLRCSGGEETLSFREGAHNSDANGSDEANKKVKSKSDAEGGEDDNAAGSGDGSTNNDPDPDPDPDSDPDSDNSALNPADYHNLLFVSLRGDDKVNVYRIDPASGSLSLSQSITMSGAGQGRFNPGPLAIDRENNRLYVAGSQSVNVYRIDAEMGSLQLLQERYNVATNTTYIMKVPGREKMMVASYGNNHVKGFSLDQTGQILGDPATIQTFSFPNQSRPHSIISDLTGENFYSPLTQTAGDDAIVINYAIENSEFRLLANPETDGEQGAGVRHMVAHHGNQWFYTSNEYSDSISLFDRGQDGKLTMRSGATQSTIDFNDNDSNSTCADVEITQNGKFVFVSNRDLTSGGLPTSDSIAAFEVDQTDGSLTRVGIYKTGMRPREFGIGPWDNYLYVAGQDSDDITIHKINANGSLSLIDNQSKVDVGDQPMWIETIAIKRVQ